MVLGAFYGSLAAAASVFIGILSVYLVNSLVTTRQEQKQLCRRRDRIETELEGLRARRKKYEDRIEEIESKWREEAVENANNRVESFIRRAVRPSGITTPPENVDFSGIVKEYAKDQDYDSVEEVSDIEKEMLREHRDEIDQALAESTAKSFVTPDRISDLPADSSDEDMAKLFKEYHGIENMRAETYYAIVQEYKKSTSIGGILNAANQMYSDIDNISIATDPAITATLNSQRRTRESMKRSQNEIQLTDVKARIDEREKRYKAIKARLDILSLSHVRKMLRDSMIAIVFSVVIPLLTYLCYELELHIVNDHAVIIPVIVFLLWFIGLIIVLVRLWLRIEKSNENNPQISRSST